MEGSGCSSHHGPSTPSVAWMDKSQSPGARAKALVAQLGLDEKIALVHGVPGPYVGNVPALARLELPALALSDGPAGVGNGATQVTAFPAPLTVAASWDVSLMQTYAATLAEEERGKGVNVHLAPMMNLARVPQAGRNFEGYGEDPYLSAVMAAAAVRGIQSRGLVATAKHFLDNDQEASRDLVSAEVDERTQREVYMLPFAAAVGAGVGAIMCAYNKVNAAYACENPHLLGILRGELRFDGWVMSDWGATHSTVAAAEAGLDMEMSEGLFFGDELRRAVTSGRLAANVLDGQVTRIASTLFRLGVWDRPAEGSLGANVRSDLHSELARAAAAAGTVLLKNDGALLPLDPARVRSIVFLGEACERAPIVAGEGSAHVTVSQVVSPLAGVKERAGTEVAVTYGGMDASTARNADVAMVCVGLTSGEGVDRPSLELPEAQNQLVVDALAANPRTVVVAHVPGTVLMPWAERVPAILVGWLPGEESGRALAALLFGDLAPSGKLPVTFARQASDFPARTQEQYPGVDLTARYSEGLFIGYRAFDRDGLAPLFPFGHGLSYTSFTYAGLVLKTVGCLVPGAGLDPPFAHARVAVQDAPALLVSWDLTNSGARAGAEVGQLYLGFPAATGEPPRRLAGFRKVALSAGATGHLQLALSQRDLAIWDLAKAAWVVPPGRFHVMVGSSSRDIRLEGDFDVPALDADCTGPRTGTPDP